MTLFKVKYFPIKCALVGTALCLVICQPYSRCLRVRSNLLRFVGGAGERLIPSRDNEMATSSSTLQELIPFEINSSDIQGLEDEDTRGSGSYGAVYAVKVRGTSRIAKRLHSILVGADVNQSEKQGIRERFLNECLLLSKLDHQNVVKFVGVHFSPEDRSDVTLIMEQLHMDLSKFLDPDQRPNIDTLTKLSILRDVSSGLLYLHTRLAKPIIHCDLTAGNVLLTEDFKQAKIADLGLSKLIDHHLHRVVTRTMCPGTLAYMPPEALTDKPKYDTPLDVFSFGQLSLYVALQQFPEIVFELPPDQSIRAYQLGEVAVLKRKKWLDMLPEDHCLRDLILSCLRDDSNKRPSTERLNMKIKVLWEARLEYYRNKEMASSSSTLQELIPFEISSSDIRGLEDEDSRGSGLYGAVYAVTVRGTPRIAKRLHSILVGADMNQSEKQGIRERFLNECLLLSKLDHQNVVKFVGVHFSPEDRSDVTLIMEQLHMDLDKFLDPDQRPNIDTYTKLSILLDVSSGLLYLHTQLAKPIIHRDLTAGNVLLTKDFKRAKIADLGVSKLIDHHLHRAVTRTACPGTLAYMPPEALTDKPKYDTPLDVFSFGQLSLYVALQQFPQVAFELPPDQSREYQLGDVAILKRKKWLDMLPKDHCLRDLILACLRDDPSERPSTERLNMKMKVLWYAKIGYDRDKEMAKFSSTVQKLIPFEITSSDIRGLEDEDIWGSGAYCALYAVTVRGTSRIAKHLHSILVGAKEIREKFLNECLLLSKLDHQNVVKFVGVHFSPEDRSDITLIMERLHMNLEKFLDPDQRPDIDTYTKLSILLDVSSGLLYLHTQLAKPIIHRDLTAGNVLLTKDFKRAKIADLGVSKLIDHHLHRAVTRTACPGTLAYMPPEALTDKPKYDTPLDVFSFGQLSLYVALQQFPQVAFELPPDQSIRAYQLGEVAILKRKKWLDMLPEDHCLRDLILSCLRDDPSERPSTERLSVKMKVLCGLELEEFEIKDVMGIIDGELYGSYTAVYKIIARGAPRIAKRLNSILDSELHSDISPSERQHIRERFHSECLALSKLDHPNILKFVGVHFNPMDRSDISIIFEHLHMSLEEFLNSQEFPDIHLNNKLSILYDVSCGLLYLHTQLELPFTHGELTAANVLLTEDLGQVKIADLGVLKLRDSYVNNESKNIRILSYLPPEAFSDNAKHATPIDLFSFGHLALYVVLQQFPEISEKVLIATRKKREIEILRRKRWIDELEQDHCLRDLILRCLKDVPEKRPTAKELNNIMSILNNATNPERKTKVHVR